MKRILFGLLLLAPFFAGAQNPNFLYIKQTTHPTIGTDTYVVTVPGIASYVSGLELKVLFNNANTGTASLNVNSIGAITLKKNGATNLSAADLAAGATYRVTYDGVNFQVLGIGGSGGGSSTYAGASPTTQTVGGLASGSAIAGLSYDDIFEAILVPYVQPAFSAFSITSQSTTVEVGTTLSGSKTFTWTLAANSGVVSTIDIYDNTAGSTLLAGTANDYTQSQTITTIQLNANNAQQSWKGIANNTSPVAFISSSNFVVTARYYRFFGPVAASPTNSATVRALVSSAFHTGATTFTLATGTVETKFVVALPPGVTISSVIDTSALNAVITSEYILTGTISVTDAGGTGRLYNIYEMNVGSPYATSHNHSILTNN